MKINRVIVTSWICLSLSLFFNHSLAKEVKSSQATLSSNITTEPSALKTVVSHYVTALQKQDFKVLRGYESWQGGQELGEDEYAQSFDKDFKIFQWRITQMNPLDNGEYRVLVLVTHNPPKSLAHFLPPGIKVSSTLNQWWKKQGDKFVHLFNIERQRLSRLMAAPK